MSGFKHILCVLTDLNSHDEVIAHARHICECHQARLTVLLVLEPLPPNANMVIGFDTVTKNEVMKSL